MHHKSMICDSLKTKTDLAAERLVKNNTEKYISSGWSKQIHNKSTGCVDYKTVKKRNKFGIQDHGINHYMLLFKIESCFAT